MDEGEGSSWSLAINAGVLAGCGGLFLPCDRGLSPLSEGVPWAMQSALYGAVFFYCFAGTTASGRDGQGVELCILLGSGLRLPKSVLVPSTDKCFEDRLFLQTVLVCSPSILSYLKPYKMGTGGDDIPTSPPPKLNMKVSLLGVEMVLRLARDA